jgi:sugar lactone lactonase YvrE
MAESTSDRASATIDCNPAPIIYSHSPGGIEKYNLSTGQFTNITNSPSQFFFDIGVTPNGRLYGVDSGGGDLYQIDKSTGATTAVGTVTLPPNTNFNMLAFDKYGKGWFVADGGAKLMSFDPTAVVSGTITPTEVVSNLQTAGFPSGSSAGDVFFVDGDMYIAWASSDNAPRDGVRLIRLDMTDTSTAYTATGAAGTATDLGKIGGNYIWGMAVYDGGIYVANGDKISRLNNLPTTADVNRTIEVTDIATGNIGVIYGMTAEGEANVDPCNTLRDFRCNAAPIIYTHSPSGIEKYNLSTGQFTNITNSPSQFFFDMGVTPNGRLYGVDSGGGDLYQIGKTAGVASLVGTVTLPPNTNFNMLAFDKYGKGWFVADGGAKLMSFDPTAVVSGTITPTNSWIPFRKLRWRRVLCRR